MTKLWQRRSSVDSLPDVKTVGFTGTRKGMTLAQRHTFNQLMKRLQPRFFHHGGCEGADAVAHDLVLDFFPDTHVVVHPPVVRTFAMPLEPEAMVEVLAPKPYLDRNKDIVKEAELMMATPLERDELLRSGTWSTIRWARHTKCPLIIIWPDGSYAKEL